MSAAKLPQGEKDRHRRRSVGCRGGQARSALPRHKCGKGPVASPSRAAPGTARTGAGGAWSAGDRPASAQLSSSDSPNLNPPAATKDFSPSNSVPLRPLSVCGDDGHVARRVTLALPGELRLWHGSTLDSPPGCRKRFYLETTGTAAASASLWNQQECFHLTASRRRILSNLDGRALMNARQDKRDLGPKN